MILTKPRSQYQLFLAKNMREAKNTLTFVIIWGHQSTLSYPTNDLVCGIKQFGPHKIVYSPLFRSVMTYALGGRKFLRIF